MKHGDPSPTAKPGEGFFRKGMLCFLVCITALTAFSGCGGEEQNSMSCEKPVYSMRAAANYGDEESYLSCWLPQEKRHFRLIGDRNIGFLGSVFSREDHESRLRVKIRGSEELDEEAIGELEAEAKNRYGSRLEFTKASKLSVDFRVQDNMDILSDSREVIVVRYNGVWYIYGEVIESFTFARS